MMHVEERSIAETPMGRKHVKEQQKLMSKAERAALREERKPIRRRRLIGVALIAAMIWGVVFLLFGTETGDTIIATAMPFYNSAAEMLEDPYALLFSVATVVIMHIGIITFLFDDSLR